MFTQKRNNTAVHSAPAHNKVKDTAFFQPKLTVNAPDDAYEQEADRVADEVMRMPAIEKSPASKQESDSPVVQRIPLTPVSRFGTGRATQRKCADCEKEEQEQVQRKEFSGPNLTGSEPVTIQRKCAKCEEEAVQRKESGEAASGNFSAPPVVGQVLSSGDGRPMEVGTRQFMENRFGQDFGQVRIHTGSQAAESAEAIGARAYTSGNNIVFGQGEYQPGNDVGKRLLAHELVHVGQQGGIHSMIQRVNRPRCHNGGRLTREEYLQGLQWLRETTRITADTEASFAAQIPSSRRERCRLIERLARGTDTTTGEDVPQPEHRVAVDTEIASVPANRFLDAFTNAYYDLDYRAIGGNLSTMVVLEYSDGTLIDFNIYDLTEQNDRSFDLIGSLSHGHIGTGGRIFPRELNSMTLPNLWRVRQHAIERMEQFNLEFMLAAMPAVLFIITMSAAPISPRPISRDSVGTNVRTRLRSGYRQAATSGGAAFNSASIADELFTATASLPNNGQKMLAAARQLSAMSNLTARQKVEVILHFLRRIGFAIRGSTTETSAYFQMISEDGRYIFQFMKASGQIRYGRFNVDTRQFTWVTL